MPKFNVLYYPYFEPPPRWFRKYLMVYDIVWTVVPNDVDFTTPPYIAKITELLPDSFKTIAPAEDDKILDDSVLHRLEKAFGLIGVKSSSEEEGFQIRISKKDGSISIDGHSLLHDDKMSDRVRDLLRQHKLIKPGAKDLAVSLGYGDFSVVDETASHLIMSLLSDRIARRKAMNTITDEKLDFAMTSLNAIGSGVASDTRNKLAYSILKFEIPEGIELLSPQEFNTLRHNYEGIRETFHRVVLDLTQLYRLDSCDNLTTLKEFINEITRDLHREVTELKRSHFGRKVARWTPLSIGSLSPIIAGAMAGEPLIMVVGTIISVTMNVIQEKFLNKEVETDQEKLVRHLADMQEDIEDVVKRLV